MTEAKTKITVSLVNHRGEEGVAFSVRDADTLEERSMLWMPVEEASRISGLVAELAQKAENLNRRQGK